jgi:class 3 adenylate cyclase/tetratricopeptide (TPR) repeat protein
MESAEAYIPRDRRHALATNTELPDYATGAVLFADISGFTPLTEALVQTLGASRGAEELTRILNQVYDALIAQVHRYHGSVLVFSGDAITCWLDDDNGLRATACGLAMQATMQQFATIATPDGGSVALAMKAAVATGVVRRFLVGNADIQRMDVVAGKPLEWMAAAEKHAEKGEVVLAPATIAALGSQAIVADWRTGDDPDNPFAVVSGLTVPVAETPWEEVDLQPLTLEVTREWLLPPIYERLSRGYGQFLAEIRPSVALFLRFQGIDYDNDPKAGEKLDAYIQWVQSCLMRYEGFLLQVTIGDKGSYLYASIGAPIAHDDDSMRAVAAALDLQSIPPTLSYIQPVQIGITRGSMRAGAYGSIRRRTYGVLGDEVNLAARLMAATEPGQTMVSQRVVMEAQQFYHFESQGEIQVKGKKRPIEVALVRGRKHLSQKQLLILSQNPLVGREQELTILTKQLEATQRGQGQIVHIEGVAGIGKSHLITAFSQQATKSGMQMFAGVCQGTSQYSAYTPWRQIFQAFFALAETPPLHVDVEEFVKEQIAQLEMMLGYFNPDWLVRLPLLGDLLDLPIPDNATTASFDARQRQEALFALITDVLQVWTADTPMVLILEDIHWIDESSLGLTLALSRVIPRTQILLLLVQRPLIEDAAMGGGGRGMAQFTNQIQQMDYYHHINLNELSPLAVAGLAQNRARGTISPLAISLVQMQSQGNPFFVEELVDALRESGQLIQHEDQTWTLAPPLIQTLQSAQCLVENEQGEWELNPSSSLPTNALGISDSVQTIVLSRIDRLPESHKLTLKVASVIGRIFELDVLEMAHPIHPKESLLREEIAVFEQRDFARIETPEPIVSYIFKHNITREVVYETLLEVQRRSLHQSVAESIEYIHPDAIEPLAYHYKASGVHDKTVYYLGKAAEKAQHSYANEIALYYYEQALELEERWQWRRGIVEISHITGERETELESLRAMEQAPGVPGFVVAYLWGQYYEAVSDYPQALEATNRALNASIAEGDRMNEVLCLSQLGMIARRQGDYLGSHTWYKQALRRILIAQTPDNKLAMETALAFAQVLRGMGAIYLNQGSFDSAKEHYEIALLLNQSSGNRQGEADVLNSLGIVADQQGQLTEAIRYYQSALDVRRAIGERAAEGGSLLNLAIVTRSRGEYAQSLVFLLDSLHIQRSIGNRWEELNVYNELGILYRILGNLAQAQEYLQQGLTISREIGDEAGQAYILSNLGAVVRDMGEYAQAQQLLEEGLALVREQGDMYMVADFLGFLATVSLHTAGYHQAITQATEAIRIQQDLDMVINTTVNLATLAQAHLQLGDTQAAQAAACQALDLLNTYGGEGTETPQHDYFACSQVLTAIGQNEAAQEALTKAYTLVMDRANNIADQQLQQSFLQQETTNYRIVQAYQKHNQHQATC